MTRARLNRTLRSAYVVLGLVLVVSLVARLLDRIPGVGIEAEILGDRLYEFLKDMAPLLIAVMAAYLANVFQKRALFVRSLEQEWRNIVRTKSELFAFCERPYANADDYLAAFCRISEALDNMRIVYRNIGETDALVGLYPYAPLHDMRRALQTLDPRKNGNIKIEDRRLARDAILQSFYALRENFLEELDLREPDHPLLISGGRRRKRPGATHSALGLQERQRARQDKAPAPRPDIDDMLASARAKEVAESGQPAPREQS